MDVVIASTNAHKVAEFRRLFEGSTLRLRTPAEAGIAPLVVVEDGHIFAENARKKALAYLQEYRMPALADDSGISVDALAGAPGIHSARFGDPQLDDAGRVAYLLEQLATIPPHERGGHYTCALALAQPDKPLLVVHGYLYGTVATAPAEGTTGFGYDPVFYLPSFGRTVSQITPRQKDEVGHRGRAARALLRALQHEGR